MSRHLRSIASMFALLLVLSIPAWAWEGEVVAIADGDKITVMHSGMAETVRLYEMTALNKARPSGNQAKEFTAEMTLRKVVDVFPLDVDAT